MVLIMTCTIRQGAEDKIYKKLQYLSKLKRRRTLGSADMKIGILGKINVFLALLGPVVQSLDTCSLKSLLRGQFLKYLRHCY